MRARTKRRGRTTVRGLATSAALVAVTIATVAIAPAPLASAVTAPSGARYTTSIVCATGSLTVRVDATGLAGSSLIQFSIDDGGGAETYTVRRGQRRSETVDGSRFLASGIVDVAEGATPVISADYDAACPNYEANQSVAPRARFVPITPDRILDTRPETRLNYTGGKPAAGGLFDLVVPGKASIPLNASAVVLNVTATEAGGPGFVQLFPAGRGTPGSSSNLNVERAGQTIPNAVIVPLGNGGAVSFFTQVGTHLVADVSGYFVPVVGATAAGRFIGTTPTRMLDTRPVSLIGYSGAKPGAGETVVANVLVPSGPAAAQVSAVVLNVTATEATANGYVQVFPGGLRGLTSNLNVEAGQTAPNLVIVPISATGTVSIFTQSGTHLLADVMGYFTSASVPADTAGLFVPLSPERIADSRPTSRIDGSDFTGAAGQTMTIFIGGLPFFELGAVILNVTATESAAAGFVQVGPNLEPGQHSNLNLGRAGQTVPNAVLVPVNEVNELDFYTQNGTQLIADIFGWFTAA